MELIDEFRVANGRVPTLADVRRQVPWLFPFMQTFPAFSARNGQTTVTYVPTKIGATQEQLGDLQQPRFGGRLPRELFDGWRDELAALQA